MLHQLRRLLLTAAALGLTMAAAACDSPTAPHRPLPRPEMTGTSASALIAATPTTVVADTPKPVDMYSDSFICNVSSQCPGTGKDTITETGGTKTPLRTLGTPARKTITVGGVTYTFDVSIWDKVNITGGDFVGVIKKNGTFAGYWGHCYFGDGVNAWYTTVEGGKTLVHWVNSHGDTTNTETYHYVYDPSTGKLKIYHRLNGAAGETLIYDGPPIQHARNLNPPDPAPGKPAWTGESQFDSTVPATTGGTTGTTGGTGTATPTTGTTSPTLSTDPAHLATTTPARAA
jgi:hypothetical protein